MQFGTSKEWRRRGSYPSGQGNWEERSPPHSNNWESSYGRNRRDWNRDYHRSGRDERYSYGYSHSRHREHDSEHSRHSRRESYSDWLHHSHPKRRDTERPESHSRDSSERHTSPIRSPSSSFDAGLSPVKYPEAVNTGTYYAPGEGYGAIGLGETDAPDRTSWHQVVNEEPIAQPVSDFIPFSPPPPQPLQPSQPSLELIKSIPTSVIRDPRLITRLLKIVQPSENPTPPPAPVTLSKIPAYGPSTSATQPAVSSNAALYPGFTIKKVKREVMPTAKSTFKDTSSIPMAEELGSIEEPPVESTPMELPIPIIKEEVDLNVVEDKAASEPQVTNTNAFATMDSVPANPVDAPAVEKPVKVPSPVPLPPSKVQSIVKESFLKLKQEGRAKMSAPSKGDSKQSQQLLKLVIGSEVASSSSALRSASESPRSMNVPMSKFAGGLKTILNSVMKTSISQVLRTKLESRSDAKSDPSGESKSKKDNKDGQTVEAEAKSSIPTNYGSSLSLDLAKVKVEPEEGASKTNRARKSAPWVRNRDSPAASLSTVKTNKTGVRSSKKSRKKFFKGTTYNLYLSQAKKKKKRLLGRDDESSVTGTETTGSLLDSDDEGSASFVSEECRSVSEKSFRQEEPPADPTLKEGNGKRTKDRTSEVELQDGVTIKQENVDGASDSKLATNGETHEDAAVLPTEEPAVPEPSWKLMDTEGVVTRRYRERVMAEGMKNKENHSGKIQSIASSVKQRQRLKRRYIEDQVDVDVVSLASSEGSGSLTKKARRAPSLPLGVTFVPEETHISTELSEITNGFIPKIEILYNTKLPAIVDCTCQGKPLDASAEELSDAKIYCQAIDSIGRKLVGCCNTITTKQLVRPSVKIPFTAVCEVHFWRLRHHHCCPTCGVFCSEGGFLQCRKTVKDRVQIHLFHKHCKGIKDNGEPCCPHCGSSEKIMEISLELNMPTTPTFYLSQKPIFVEPKARMSFSRQAVPEEVEDAPSVTYSTLDLGKILSSAGLPQGPNRTELETLLAELKNEKLDDLTYTISDLYKMAKAGNVGKVLRILALNLDPNLKLDEKEKETPLHVAAAEGHLVVTHLLIQAGASLDHVDEHLYTPLMHAVEHQQVQVVQYLVKAGAQLDAKGEDGMCGLHLAARGGNLDICKAFLDTGRVNVNIQDDGGWTPIVWAAEHRHLKIVRLLIERGADPNIRDNELNNALHWSAFSGNVEISQLFLDLGLSLAIGNEHGDTPLHIAARQNNYECVVLFLARGANIDTTNKEKEIALKCCPDTQSQTYIALTMNYELKRLAANRTVRAERVTHRDISRGKELNPIQCVNGVDDDLVPTDYLYIIENCETSPISIDRTISSLQSCQCEDDCTSASCTCATISFKCWYDNDGRLLPEFNLPDPPMIFECNRACLCWKNCNNRALQHGMPSRLQLFKTRGKGWGVRTLKDIPRGTFVCEYIGEIITDNEADQREDDSYLFDLDNRDGETYCLDARYYGNVSRFINHLCEPNLVPVKIFVEHQDLSFPRIAFFSSRDIKAYEELGFDYGEKFWVIKYKWFTCTCGASKCKYSAETIHDTLENFRRTKDEHVEEDVVVQKEEGW